MNTRITLALLLPLASCAAAGAGPGHDPAADSQFERLKALEGEWVTVAEPGGAEAGLVIRYHVVGAGSALVESMFPGTEQEMVTVYHKDGGALVLTHYCALGNQPEMAAEKGGGSGAIRFRFTGGANIDPEKSAYMSGAEFTFVDDAHVVAAWTHHEPGKKAETLRFSMVRSWR